MRTAAPFPRKVRFRCRGGERRRSHFRDRLTIMHMPARHEIETVPALRTLGTRAVPPEICDWFRRLAALGHSSRLVGETALQLALGLRPTHYRAHSSIERGSLLALAPRAVPTGVASGAVTLATTAGPLDVLTDRHIEQTVRELESNHFGVLTLTFDPLSGETNAAPQALSDVTTRSLRPTDDVSPCTSPVFALDAARLISVYGLVPSESLLASAGATRSRMRPSQIAQARRLLRETLLAPNVDAGLAFLRDSGALTALVSGVGADAPARVARVPAELRPRLAAWLLDADAKELLRRLRFGGEFSSNLYHLLAHHPIDECVRPGNTADARKLLGHLSSVDITDLLELRRAEAAVLRETNSQAESDRILVALQRVNDDLEHARQQQRQREQRTRLAISSAEIMQALSCEPGPIVGRAIRFLEQTVAANPDANTPETLRAELDHWRDVR